MKVQEQRIKTAGIQAALVYITLLPWSFDRGTFLSKRYARIEAPKMGPIH